MPYTVPDYRSQLLTMLSPLEHGLQHADIQEGRVEGVGEWLIQSEEFRRWNGFEGEGGADEAVLFVYGGPGVGKTFISSLVVDRLRDQATQNTTVPCFYFDFAVRKELPATAILGSMLRQMINGMEILPKDILRGLKEQLSTIYGHEPQLADIVKILQLITSAQPTFMCIDGLDECAGAQRVRILDSLKQILERCPSTRVFLTGRPQIRAEIEERLAGRVISVSVRPSNDDIITYLRARLAEDEIPDAMDQGLEVRILETIAGVTSGIFLLASLSIEGILHETTINQRRERLREMTHGLRLGDAYGAAIQRIKAQGKNESRLGIKALMWISHAERPLTVDELCHALAIELGSMDFDADNVPSMLTLLGCCQGLIAVDKDPSIVRLIHHTLQEYLSVSSNIFIRPHSAIAETCLTYLNSERVMAVSNGPAHDAQEIPFLEYCALNWGIHAKRELSVRSRSLALQMFQEYDGHISVKMLFGQLKSRWVDFDDCSKFSGLDSASFFGITELATAAIETRPYDINKGHLWGYTPLAWAAHNGQEEVVKILLDAQADPDEPDEDRETPLSHAARNGHEGVVRILLALGKVDPNHRCNCGITPLMHAARNGHRKVVKLLLKRKGINPDRRISSGQTPLEYAAQAGDEGVVKTLLKCKDVNPDRPSDDRRPLSYAAQNGHEGVVKMLLQQQTVCPNKPCSQYGRTPLSYAAERGHEGVVERLLERQDVNPDKLDISGRTPLSYAACCGREEVVKILLKREGVDPDKSSYEGQTPLSYAAQKGYERVVRILLEQKEVNPDKSDTHGKTPLLYAALEGHLGVVKRLLEREEVNPDTQDHTGQTPLAYAAGKGHGEMVKVLLARAEVDPNKQSIYGRTPLSQATYRGYEDVVKALLQRQQVNPDTQDNIGKTPLLYAASRGHEGLVKALLGRGEVNPDRQDNEGQTPLFAAARWGRDSVVKMLLERQDVTPGKPNDQGQTPLMSAYANDHKRVIELLQPHEAVDPEPNVKRPRHHHEKPS